MADVFIKQGVWGHKVIKDHTFTLVRGLRSGQKGPFLLVNGSGNFNFPQRNFRVFVQNVNDFEIIGDDALLHSSIGHELVNDETNFVQNPPANLVETDDEIRNRLIERFEILQQLTRDVAIGSNKGLVIWGASGVGKSFEVEAALNRDSLIDKLAFNAGADDQDSRRIDRQGHFKPRYQIVKGYSTAPALYTTLYEYSESNETLVFDDCDSVLGDETSLNLLKAALDTSNRRIIQWRSNSRNATDAPNSFEFKGAVIFITNINFEKIVGKGTSKLCPHLEAIMSRCLCLDLTIDTNREKLIRIDHVCRDLRMLELQHGLDPIQVEEVLAWTSTNANKFRELSLRKVGQLATLRKSNQNWQRVAEITLLRQR